MIDRNDTVATFTTNSTPSGPAGSGHARFVGITLVAASLLALAGNLLHPRWSDDDVTAYGQMARSALMPTADVVLLAAFLLMTVGLVALVDGLRGDSSLKQTARLAALVGGSIALIQTCIELYGLHQEARTFASIPSGGNNVAPFFATNAVEGISDALFAAWGLILLGLAPILITLALRKVARCPMWLAVVGFIGGGLCTGVGIFDLLHDDQGDANIPFLIGSLLVTVWLVGCGWLNLVRQRGTAN
jgi:hypothetical protein